MCRLLFSSVLKTVTPPPTHTFLKRPFLTDFKKHHIPPPTERNFGALDQNLKKPRKIANSLRVGIKRMSPRDVYAAASLSPGAHAALQVITCLRCKSWGYVLQCGVQPRRLEGRSVRSARAAPSSVPEGGSFGRCEIWNGKTWHNKIVPHFAMVFTDRSHLLRCRRGWGSQARPRAFETWLQHVLTFTRCAHFLSITRFRGAELSDFMFC